MFYHGYNEDTLYLYKLDYNDLRIFDYLEQFFNNGQAKTINHDQKVYFFITYRKIFEDLPNCHLGIRAIKDRFKKYKKLGIIDIYKPVDRSTRLFVKLDLTSIREETERLFQLAGIDKSLQYKNYFGDKFYSTIEYNSYECLYFNTAIDMNNIRLYNKTENRAFKGSFNSFKDIFLFYLKGLVSEYLWNSRIKNMSLDLTNPHKIRVIMGFKDRETAREHIYRIEKALCSAYLYMIGDREARKLANEIRDGMLEYSRLPNFGDSI